MKERQSWGWKLILWIDLGIAIFFFDAELGELASSYMGRNMMGSWQQRTTDWVFQHIFRQGPDHCLNSIQPQFTQGR